jgi:hypothetical protein
MSEMFAYSTLHEVPGLDLREASDLTARMFYATPIYYIEGLIVDNNTEFVGMFDYCTNLHDVTFRTPDAKITYDVDLHWSSDLSVSSAKSLIMSLHNFTGTENTYSATIKLHDNTWAKLDALGEDDCNGMSWRDYVCAELCWNI